MTNAAAASDAAIPLGPADAGRGAPNLVQALIWLVSVLGASLLTALGVRGSSPATQDLAPAPPPVASAAALESTESKLLAAVADSRAKALELASKQSEQLAKQSEQLAILISKQQDSVRRIEANEARLDALAREVQARTADRYSRGDAAREKDLRDQRDDRQDEWIRQLQSGSAKPPR